MSFQEQMEGADGIKNTVNRQLLFGLNRFLEGELFCFVFFLSIHNVFHLKMEKKNRAVMHPPVCCWFHMFVTLYTVDDLSTWVGQQNERQVYLSQHLPAKTAGTRPVLLPTIWCPAVSYCLLQRDMVQLSLSWKNTLRSILYSRCEHFGF